MTKELANGKVNTHGYEVEVSGWEAPDGKVIYNAYVEIPNSQYLRTSYIGYDASYRDGDVIGVDTNHKCYDGYSGAELAIIALEMIQRIIERCELVLKKEET